MELARAMPHISVYLQLNMKLLVDLATGAGPAAAHFVSANGDSLFCEGYGQGTDSGTPGVAMIVESYIITGGTGRFAGAKVHLRLSASSSLLQESLLVGSREISP